MNKRKKKKKWKRIWEEEWITNRKKKSIERR